MFGQQQGYPQQQGQLFGMQQQGIPQQGFASFGMRQQVYQQQSDASNEHQKYSQANEQLTNSIKQYQQVLQQVNNQLGPTKQQESELMMESQANNGFDMNTLLSMQQQETQTKVIEYKQLLKQIYEKENQEIMTYRPMDLSSLFLFSQQVTKEDVDLLQHDYTLPSFEIPNTIDDVITQNTQQLLQLSSASQISPIIKYQKKGYSPTEMIGGVQQIIQVYISKGYKTLFVIQTSCGNVFGILYHVSTNQIDIHAIKFVSPLENDFNKLPNMVSVPPLQGPRCLDLTLQLDRLSISFDSQRTLTADPQFAAGDYYVVPQWENINIYYFH